MDDLYKFIIDNPPYLIAVFVLAFIVVAYSVIKKFLNIVIVLIACFILYIAYLKYTGDEIPESIEEIMNQAEEKIEKGMQKAENSLEKEIQKVGEKIEKEMQKAEEKIEEGFKKNIDFNRR
tara:strand:- start:181 stop:543 length:363 start_codon:yes stop_codon:yes gene_type:complete